MSPVRQGRVTLHRRLEPLIEGIIYLCGFSAVLFVFPHASDDSVGEVSFV